MNVDVMGGGREAVMGVRGEKLVVKLRRGWGRQRDWGWATYRSQLRQRERTIEEEGGEEKEKKKGKRKK